MLVSEAAKRLGMNTQTLRLALQQGLFPFGCAVLTSEKRYTYYINEIRLQRYLEGREYEIPNHITGGNESHCTSSEYNGL